MELCHQEYLLGFFKEVSDILSDKDRLAAAQTLLKNGKPQESAYKVFVDKIPALPGEDEKTLLQAAIFTALMSMDAKFLPKSNEAKAMLSQIYIDKILPKKDLANSLVTVKNNMAEVKKEIEAAVSTTSAVSASVERNFWTFFTTAAVVGAAALNYVVRSGPK